MCSFSNNPRVLGGSVVVKSSNQVNEPWVYSIEGSVVQLFHVFDNILSFE